jgi:hypothetical protein
MAAALRTAQCVLNCNNSPVTDKRKRKTVSSSGMSDAEEKVQAAFLAKDITEYLLNENGFNLNGYTGVLPGNLRDIGDEDPACVREESFQKARKNIAKCCFYLKRRHGEEIEEMCQNLDIDDEQLHPNFEEVLASIWEEPRNWGRLASLFIAAYFICERLRKEGAEDKIDSVIGWLSVYLKRHAVPWVREHGGFAGALYGTNPLDKKTVDDCRTDYSKAGLLTIALGLGAAVVVGAIVGK